MIGGTPPACFTKVDKSLVLDGSAVDKSEWDGVDTPIVSVLACGGSFSCHHGHHFDQICECMPSTRAVAECPFVLQSLLCGTLWVSSLSLSIGRHSCCRATCPPRACLSNLTARLL